ncbi:MAG: aminotransferase class III-fold pyridoxal phosphate-dependent enzyme [Pseudomonadota bacterium]
MAASSTPDLRHWQRVLSEQWPVDGPLKRLHGEHDLNLATGSLVYKVMRAGLSEADIAPQIACHRHVAAAGVTVPAPVPTHEGRLSTQLADERGELRTVWVLERLAGTAIAHLSPWTPALAQAIGEQTARLHGALVDFDHPAIPDTHAWDIRALTARPEIAEAIAAHAHGDTLRRILDEHTGPACRALEALPCSPIHNDLNEHNILAHAPPCGEATLTGLIDFGDMLRAPTVVDLAIAAAYLVVGARRPWPLLRALIRGYCTHRPLPPTEQALLWPLLLSRVAQSAINATLARLSGRDDPYLQISQRRVSAFLATHADEHPHFVHALVARASGAPAPSRALIAWIASPERQFAPIFHTTMATAPVLDLSVTGEHACDDPVRPDLTQIATAVSHLGAEGEAVLGRYAEPRLIYGAPFFLSSHHGASDRRTVHIAIDVFLPAGTPVHSPLPATVHSAEVCDDAYDYGGLVTLRHEGPNGTPFYTSYGHLSHASVRALAPGQTVPAGEVFATLGEVTENGGWPPHVHLQIGTTGMPGSRWPGVVDPDDAPDWQDVFPDPAALLGLPTGHVTYTAPPADTLQAQRETHSPPSLRTSYHEPLTVVRGWQSLLFDNEGRTYLDAYNNVPHVGHAHPRVRAAIDRQLRLVNTNTRYLQPIHAEYTAALAARLPSELEVVFLLSSGSEANELALRLARTATGATDTVVLAAGYHGHTVTAIDISDYKFSGPGGEGAPDWVHVVPNPDAYRAGLDPDDPRTGAHFAAEVSARIEAMVRAGRTPACFIAETFPSVGGQLIPPPGYLSQVYGAIRQAGGLCIADEVQTGLGRLGRYFWGFEQQQVVPDIVVLGKPMGNGFPLAAVVTTRAIAERFDTGMEFFATFGGSSAACAAGLAVLEVIDQEALGERAHAVGSHLLAGLRDLARRHPLLADVRGLGLFIGVEIADANHRPLPEHAAWIVERLRQERVLIGRDGPDHNVLKIRPPLAFSEQDADHLLERLNKVLAENALSAAR